MSWKIVANRDSRPARKLPLPLVLVVPFVLQLFMAVGLTGYLSLRNGQKVIHDLVIQLENEVTARIDQHLDTYLATPHTINQTNVDAMELGLLNLRDFKGAGRYLWKQMQAFNVGYIYYALSTGEYAAAGYDQYPNGSVLIEELSPNTKHKTYSYSADSRGNRTKLVEIYNDYEPQKEAWYKDTVQAGKPVWSQVYQWDSYAHILSISAGYPLYNNTNTLIGVLSVDLRLEQISDFLRQLKISPKGKIFIVEPSGLLIASSSTEPPFTMVKGEAQRLKAADSKDALIQATAKHLIASFGGFSKIKASQNLHFSLNNQRQFAQITPWQDEYGLNWLIVVAVPESDFMAQINANTRTSILLCLEALGLATVLGIFTSRWITQPILRLSTASQAIASGNLEQKVEVKGIKELVALAQSFNQMAGQLRESFTALEKARDAADAANRAKSEFLANISHELRTPLNGILGYAQILQQDKTLNSEQKHGISIMHQCGFHLLTLINDLLDVSKIEAHKLELFPVNFRFEKFLLGVCEICCIKADQKEVDFSYQPDKNLPNAVYADEKRLRQVLINLLGNAIKFTNEGSVIFKVELNYPDNKQTTSYKIRFQVEDTGIGMTPEQLEKIFLPFEQVGDRLRKVEGAGLGLAISNSIVRMMGSEIRVESTYGEGSKFWFELDLPGATDWFETEPFPPQQRIVGCQGEQKTILIVDDRWENCSVIVNLLEPIGFRLIKASHGQEGLAKAKEFKPDLIITDLAMPVMDGQEMTQRLRGIEEFKDTVVLASSALVSSFDQQSREAGYDGFLAKPVEASELLDQIQHHLKLTWIYESQEELDTNQKDSAQADEMFVPPKEELTTLYKAAKAGRVLEIQEEAQRIKELDVKYTIFAEHVIRLAEEFEDEAILELVKPYLS